MQVVVEEVHTPPVLQMLVQVDKVVVDSVELILVVPTEVQTSVVAAVE